MPGLKRTQDRFALWLDSKVNYCCCATMSRGLSTCQKVISRSSSAKRHIHMGVRVNSSGNHQLVSSINYLVRLHIKLCADQLDCPSLDEDVSTIIIDCCNNSSVLYKCFHCPDLTLVNRAQCPEG